MTVARATGYPDYTTDGSNKNIPWLYSRKLLEKFYDKSSIAAITRNDFSADIKNHGDKVIIRTRPTVAVKAYTKGGATAVEFLESSSVEFPISRGNYFYFTLDKIDIHQFDLDMMSEYAQDAAEQVDIYIGNEFYGEVYVDAAAANKGLTAGRKTSAFNLGTTGSPVTLNKTNILDYIVCCSTVADEQNWPTSERWMVLPPIIHNLLSRSDLKNASFSGDGKTSLMKHGFLGEIAGFSLYDTNLYPVVTDGGNKCFNLLFGHKSAIGFASQVIESVYFDKLENTVGKAMRETMLYDFKTVKTDALGVLYATYDLGM